MEGNEEGPWRTGGVRVLEGTERGIHPINYTHCTLTNCRFNQNQNRAETDISSCLYRQTTFSFYHRLQTSHLIFPKISI